MGVGMLVFGIVGGVDLVGRVGMGALVEVVLAGGASYGRVLEFGRAVVFRCIASTGRGSSPCWAMGIGVVVTEVVRRVKLVGQVREGALVGVVLACRGSYGRAVSNEVDPERARDERTVQVRV